MHANSTFKHWMHQLHTEGIQFRHMTGHMLHERSFWAIASIIVMLAAMFALLILLGQNTELQINDFPLRYMW